MAKLQTKKRQSLNMRWLTYGAFFLSLLFLVSVIQNVNVAAFNAPGYNALQTKYGVWGDGPNSWALLASSALLTYLLLKQKKLGAIELITLTTIVVSSLIWLFGLHISYI